MMFLTHLAVSLVAAVFFFNELSIPALAALMLGSLLPDIDSTKSFLGSKLLIIGFIFRHRGIFHSLIAIISLGALSYYLMGIQVTLAFLAGYAIHLLLDMLTHEGITPFFPFEFRMKGFFQTGGIVDYLIFFAAAGIGLAIVFN
jgi:inner membrane protein